MLVDGFAQSLAPEVLSKCQLWALRYSLGFPVSSSDDC